MEQRHRKSFPCILMQHINESEDLFNVNIWMYELVEDVKCVKEKLDKPANNNFIDDEADEAGESSDSEDEETADRRKKVQIALLVRAPSFHSQQIAGRLKVYTNIYKDHASLITNTNQYGQCYRCKCGKCCRQSIHLEEHMKTCTGEKTQKLIFPGTGITVPNSIWDQLEQLGITTTGPKHFPYFACWNFEARINQDNNAKFTPLPKAATQLPQHECLNNEMFTISNPDLSQLDQYCYIIASQQPGIFDIRVTIIYQTSNDSGEKQQRKTIIQPVNIIHDEREYNQIFSCRTNPGYHESNLILFRQILKSIPSNSKWHCKQLQYTSTLSTQIFRASINQTTAYVIRTVMKLLMISLHNLPVY